MVYGLNNDTENNDHYDENDKILCIVCKSNKKNVIC